VCGLPFDKRRLDGLRLIVQEAKDRFRDRDPTQPCLRKIGQPFPNALRIQVVFAAILLGKAWLGHAFRKPIKS
jgi:hypothetical protein